MSKMGVHTSLITPAHGYTREDVPWVIDNYQSLYGKLIQYLSGGGMSTFGRTIRQEVMRRRQQRFLGIVGGLSLVWLIFYFV